jgi:hypothetical protein
MKSARDALSGLAGGTDDENGVVGHGSTQQRNDETSHGLYA